MELLYNLSAENDDEKLDNFRFLENMVRLTSENFGGDVKLSSHPYSVGIHSSDADHYSDCILSLDIISHSGILHTVSFAEQARKFMIAYKDSLGLYAPCASLNIDLRGPVKDVSSSMVFYDIEKITEESDFYDIGSK